MTELRFEPKNVDGWAMHALEFGNDKSVIMTVVHGKLSNAQTKPGQKIRFPRQQEIAKIIKSKRGDKPRNKNSYYAISLGMRFSRHANQKQPLDVDNFIKPIFAGTAAGLFSHEIPSSLKEFDLYDDSHFVYLYVEHLPDEPDKEGVAIVISEEHM